MAQSEDVVARSLALDEASLSCDLRSLESADASRRCVSVENEKVNPMVITGKSIGRKRPLFADWSIPLPPDWNGDGGDGGGDRDGDGGPTLRDVIERIVRVEVNAFKKRQHDRQFLRALTEREIEAAAERGKIEMGGSEVGIQEVDEDTAVATALLAFEDGIYLVVIDDVEQRDLDQQVYMQPDSRITFIRLTLLSGG